LEKLEKWEECVSDYEVAVKIFPGDAKHAEALLHAQIALKESQVGDVAHLITRSKVKEITTLNQLQEAISIPGKLSIYH
jgi:hypothetical protein